MKLRTILLALLSLFIAQAATAGDLPGPAAINKALTTPIATCTPQNCSGWYGGFGFAGAGSNVDIVGQGINNSVFSAGGIIKAQGGYQFWNGSWFAAIDLSVGGEFTTTTSAGVPVVPNQKGQSKLFGSEMIKLGYNFFSSPASGPVVPSQSPIPLIVPANLLAASTPYFQFGGVQRRGQTAWGNGAGFQTVIAQGWTSDVKYIFSPSQNGLPTDNLVMVEINKHF
jgi:opacity protein-like surface antigen